MSKTVWVPAGTQAIKDKRRMDGKCDVLVHGYFGAVTWCDRPLGEGHRHGFGPAAPYDESVIYDGEELTCVCGQRIVPCECGGRACPGYCHPFLDGFGSHYCAGPPPHAKAEPRQEPDHG